MFGKFEILLIIIVILVLFYLVISFGAKKKISNGTKEIKRYLFGVRVLIILIAIIFFILWIVGYSI